MPNDRVIQDCFTFVSLRSEERYEILCLFYVGSFDPKPGLCVGDVHDVPIPICQAMQRLSGLGRRQQRSRHGRRCRSIQTRQNRTSAI